MLAKLQISAKTTKQFGEEVRRRLKKGADFAFAIVDENLECSFLEFGVDFLKFGVDFLEKVALLISVSCQRLVYPPVAFSFFDGFRARNAPPYSCYG